ncbi:MAG: T9SS type A sorting domain-containing protein [Candidatus Zixiibacteriota bacterium]|nr:MAG: T9SS type A sorting domain-containing protein [candidate division Zixibacteria bacterium]
MKMRYLIILSAVLSLTFSGSWGQGIFLENVEGLAGPVEDSAIVADGTTEIIFNLRLVGLGGTDTSLGLTAGLRVFSEDGATWGTTSADTLDVGVFWNVMFDAWGDDGFFINYFGVTGSGVDTIGLGGIATRKGLPGDFDQVAFAVKIGPISSDHVGKTIILDSCFYPPAGYWVLADSEGSFAWSGPHHFVLATATDVKDVSDGLPHEYSLAQNYPNPFNPTTEILFDVPRRSRVTIAIFNVMGQKVRDLVDEELPAGSYQRSWDGTNNFGESVSTGIYLCRMEAGLFVQSRKMVLVK